MSKAVQNKKPNLEINTNPPTDFGGKTMSTGFSFHEDPQSAQYKSVSTVTSPTNKNIKPIA